MAGEKVRKNRLEWLGQLARMPEYRLPKSTVFSWLPQPRPRCGPRTRWRDVVRKDLKDIGVKEDDWYEEATRSRAGWKAVYCSRLLLGAYAYIVREFYQIFGKSGNKFLTKKFLHQYVF